MDDTTTEDEERRRRRGFLLWLLLLLLAILGVTQASGLRTPIAPGQAVDRLPIATTDEVPAGLVPIPSTDALPPVEGDGQGSGPASPTPAPTEAAGNDTSGAPNPTSDAPSGPAPSSPATPGPATTTPPASEPTSEPTVAATPAPESSPSTTAEPTPTGDDPSPSDDPTPTDEPTPGPTRPSGPSGSASPAPDGPTASGHVDGLYPGARTQLHLLVDNPFDFAIDVLEVATEVGAPDHEGCPADAVVVSAWRGQARVEAGQQVVLVVDIAMAASAPDACKGAEWPLTFTGTAQRSTS